MPDSPSLPDASTRLAPVRWLGLRRWVAETVVPSPLLTRTSRPRVLALLGADVDPAAKLSRGLRTFGPLLTVGPGAFVNIDVTLNNSARITLGPGAFLAPGVLITTTHHDIGPQHQRAGRLDCRPVVIGSGSWLGARVTVLPGVTIGAGCVIAAGAVVTRDCETNGFYAGVPAVRRRDLPSG